jgi:hypothetical protein
MTESTIERMPLATTIERRDMGKLNTGLTIFILFFGVALIEAIEKHNWLESALFLALGGVSFWADRRKK